MARQNEFVDTLKYELGMATKWSRPSISILSANNPFQFFHCAYLASLAANSAGLNLVHIHLSPTQFDLPIAIREFGEVAKSFFLCTGMDNGGGEHATNAYKAVNIRREWLVEDGTKVIISGTKREVNRIAIDAPDFWAFRHHVFTTPRLRRPLSPFWMFSIGLFENSDQPNFNQFNIDASWIEKMDEQYAWFDKTSWRESLAAEYLRRYVISSLPRGITANEVKKVIIKQQNLFTKKFLSAIHINNEETTRGQSKGEFR